jgi:hypothetical protein
VCGDTCRNHSSGIIKNYISEAFEQKWIEQFICNFLGYTFSFWAIIKGHDRFCKIILSHKGPIFHTF